MTDDSATYEKKSIALMSYLVALFLTNLKIAVGLSTGRLGVLAKATYNALDLLAVTFAFFTIHVSARPVDSHNSYSHDKAENLAALALTGNLLLFFTCGWVIRKAINSLIGGPGHMQVSVWAFIILAISMAIYFNRVCLLYHIAKKHKSQALEADTLHFPTYIFSPGVATLGLAAVWISCRAKPSSLLQTVHQVVTHLEKQLFKQFPRLDRINIHTDVLKERDRGQP